MQFEGKNLRFKQLLKLFSIFAYNYSKNVSHCLILSYLFNLNFLKKMGASKNNTNAQKWTKTKAKNIINKALQIARNGEVLSFSDIASELNIKTYKLMYVLNKFSEFADDKKEIKELIKNTLIKKGLYNEVNTTMAIFVLKNDYDMNPVEKVEKSQTVRNVEVTEEDLRKFNEKFNSMF